MLLIGLFYILVPAILITLLATKKHPAKFKWALSSLVTGAAILFICTIARWEIVSIYFRYLFPLLFLIACVISFKRIKTTKKPGNKINSYIGIGLNVFVLFFLSVMSFLALRGYKTPNNPVELSSPLRNGKFIVLHGGSRPMINAHFNGSAQNYAIDIVGLNALGMRATTIGGVKNLNDYVIYGKPVYSPCKGKILAVVDKFNDLTPPNIDTENIAGNYVLIGFEGKEVFLAHLKRGSVKVKIGELVGINTLLAEVGNTGNTSEPHLHMHVEQGGTPNTILNGEAVPFTINGKFLVRGSIINIKK